MEDIRREQIGIVGVGNMGGAIGRSMLREGFQLTAFDLSETARNAIAEPRRVARADAGSGGREVQGDLDRGRHRPAGARRRPAARQPGPGGDHRVIHSTIRPGTVVDLAALGAERGVSVLDVSVNGGNEKAALGTLTLMVGGPADVVKYCWPLFESFGQNIFHMGPVGSGVVGKLVNNLIALGSYALQMEAMRLAASYGLEEDDVTGAVIASMGDNRGIRTWGRHDRKRAIRASQGVDWSERMGRDLEEAAIAAGARGELLPVTAMIAEAMPTMIRRRDRDRQAARSACDPALPDLQPGAGQGLQRARLPPRVHPGRLTVPRIDPRRLI